MPNRDPNTTARSTSSRLVRAQPAGPIKALVRRRDFLTTLAFWLRSSVVSVLNSLTTIMEAPPPFLVILFLPPQLLGLCLHPSDVMTLPLHYWPASSGDPSFRGRFSLLYT